MPIQKALEEMEKFYEECCKEAPMPYLYGFFDALAIVRDLAEKS